LVLFCLNPQKSQKKIIEISGIKEKIFAKRKIDKNLLKLNQRGFLNGHTPFTAYLSFLSVLIAALKDCKFVVFSNEKSANEGNLRYLGKTINHQYSKSEIFEKKFRLYIKKYLIENLQYFSLLRALNESEVVKLFIQFPQYFMVFSSCNSQFKIENKIKERWCKNCPKCLFIFTTLYSLLGKKTVLKIFKTNLFENKTLRETMLQLVGKKKFKPFECVGTIKENKKIFEKALERWQKEEKKLPYLLSIFAKIKNGN
ncbi:hypothetical protein H5T58_03425, partial [Candidatus Parcubacteria bacterium]|nr:hypothetical protein [Candidatus Parcubacteria bacterium]